MEEIKDEKKISQTMYLLKFFAIFSIILAHTRCEDIENDYIRVTLSIIKALGVYIFFIISGYYFKPEKYKNFFNLLKDKVIKICIPWFISGAIVYVVIFKTIKFYCYTKEIINFILGNGSYLYYMTVLLISYIIVYLLPKRKVTYIILIIINFIVIILLNVNILPKEVDNTKFIFTYLNPYLNILNWIGVFSIGILINKYLKLWKWSKKELIISNIVFFVIIGYIIITKNELSYWKTITLILGILNFIIMFNATTKIKSKLLMDIGKKSYSIYLWHLPIVVKISYIIDAKYSIIIPIFTIAILYMIIKIGEIIAKKIKIYKIYNILVGNR